MYFCGNDIIYSISCIYTRKIINNNDKWGGGEEIFYRLRINFCRQCPLISTSTDTEFSVSYPSLLSFMLWSETPALMRSTMIMREQQTRISFFLVSMEDEQVSAISAWLFITDCCNHRPPRLMRTLCRNCQRRERRIKCGKIPNTEMSWK